MPFLFNPLTGTLDRSAAGSGGGGVTSVNSITGAVTLVAGSGITVTPSGSDITIASTGGGSTNSFTTIQPDNGTSPVATSPTDTLTLHNSDGNIIITGNSGTDTITYSLATDVGISGTIQSPIYYFPGGDNMSDGTIGFNALSGDSPFTFTDLGASQTVFTIGSYGNGIGFDYSSGTPLISSNGAGTLEFGSTFSIGTSDAGFIGYFDTNTGVLNLPAVGVGWDNGGNAFLASLAADNYITLAGGPGTVFTVMSGATSLDAGAITTDGAGTLTVVDIIGDGSGLTGTASDFTAGNSSFSGSAIRLDSGGASFFNDSGAWSSNQDIEAPGAVISAGEFTDGAGFSTDAGSVGANSFTAGFTPGFIGDGSGLTNVPGSSITGAVSEAYNAGTAEGLDDTIGDTISGTGSGWNISGTINGNLNGLATAAQEIYDTGTNAASLTTSGGVISISGGLIIGSASIEDGGSGVVYVPFGLSSDGDITTTGNVVGTYIYGDGSNLTNLPGPTVGTTNIPNAVENAFLYTDNIGVLQSDNSATTDGNGNWSGINTIAGSDLALGSDLNVNGWSLNLVDTVNFTAANQTTYSGSVSGSAVWSMPFQGASYKKFVINLSALNDAGGTIAFPIAFSVSPYLYGNAAAVAVSSANTTTFTLTATAGVTGNVFVEGA